MLKQAVSAIVALSVMTAAASAQRLSLEADPARAAQVDAIFADYDKPTSPGCAVAVYHEDRIVYRRAYGMANLDHDVRLTPGSVFHVASVSKQFTAAAILVLAQEGKLSLGDDIRKYVPELPDFGQTITIRHLANHTSGIRDQWDLLGLAGWRYSRDLITDDDVLELLRRQKDLNFKPGERHLYSNSGYTLLAIIVSRVSGQSFREFTDARIFKPLGMANTHFRDRFTDIVKNQAYGYAPDRGTFRLSVTNFDTAGATSLLTTVEDMARWHANFDTRTVGGDRLVTGLLERGVLNDGRRIDYALGISHGTYRGLATVGHGGSDAGYRSVFMRFPAQRFGVACLCNLASANPTALSRRVAEVFLSASLAPETGATPDDAPEAAVPEQELSRYAGLYWNQAASDARRIVVENGRLHAVFGSERIPMKSLGAGRFVLTAGARTPVTFEEEPAAPEPRAKAGRLRIGSEAADVYLRAEPFTPARAQLDEFAGVYRSDEMDAVFRMVVKDDQLRLERLKSAPAALEPLVANTFRAPIGTIEFVRDSAGRVSGFVLESGRLRHVKFWKDTTAVRTLISAAR